ncbi:TPA: hypothetical protein SMQ86_000214 [Pseudomonas aeruginosa]|nr:hypothetical protein [Pseudomonas aeruginosa]HEK1305198.1 hypothetical protein [Pseudomonas aeruginosa]
MTAEQTEVVGQDVAVERVTKLGSKRAAADPTGQAAEDGARYGTKGDPDRTGERTDSGASPSPGESCTDSTCNTAHGAYGGSDFHGVVEGSDFRGVTARALQ